nr:uncharacterized protein LOC123282265 [Equus asinus]
MSLSHISETGKVTHGTGSAHARASQQPRLPEAPTRRAGSSTLNHSAILPGAPVVPQPGVPHPALRLPQGPFQTNCLQTPVPVCSERKACAELLDSFPVQPERTTKKSPSVATMPTCYPLVRVKVLGRARGYQLGGRSQVEKRLEEDTISGVTSTAGPEEKRGCDLTVGLNTTKVIATVDESVVREEEQSRRPPSPSTWRSIQLLEDAPETLLE